MASIRTRMETTIGTQIGIQKLLGESKSQPARPKTPDVETIDLTDSPPPPSKDKAPMDLDTPQYLFTPEQQKAYEETGAFSAAPMLKERNDSMTAAPPLPLSFFNPQRRIVSYKTLQDFYGLLDKIERTSYVGAIFLEACAERLRDDLCKASWLKRNVNLDLY